MRSSTVLLKRKARASLSSDRSRSLKSVIVVRPLALHFLTALNNRTVSWCLPGNLGCLFDFLILQKAIWIADAHRDDEKRFVVRADEKLSTVLEMTTAESLVFLIDDDASVRKGVARLLRAAGYENEIFASASDFLTRPPHSGPSCVIVDVQMPGINGMDLQKELIQRRREEQLVFITGHGDIPMCSQAMKAGAVDFLPKPFRAHELLQCVQNALIRSAEQRRRSMEKNEAGVFLIC